MLVSSTLRVALAAGLVWGLTASPSAAQGATTPRSARPYRGVYGGGVNDEAQQLLTFSASAGGGYDDDLTAEASGSTAAVPGGQRSGSFGLSSVEADYSLNRKRVSFKLGVASDARFYPDFNPQFLASHHARATGSLRVSRHSALQGSTEVTYAPFSQVFRIDVPLGDVAPVVVPDQSSAIGLKQFLRRESTLAYSYEVTRRLSAEISGSYRVSPVSSSVRQESTIGRGGFTYGIGRGLFLRAFYGQEKAIDDRDGFRTTYDNRIIDAGLGFNRSLSVTRRLSLSFNSGMSAVTVLGTVHYAATGDATLTREIGRSWMAAVKYRRDISLLELLSQPVLSDGVTAALTGLVTRRLEFSATAGVEHGTVGFTLQDSNLSTARGGLSIRYALSRNTSLGADYIYYHYTFGSGVPLPDGLSAKNDRQSVRVRVSFWVPVIHRVRRGDAAR